MDTPASYCRYVAGLPLDDLHRVYHDTAYGFPLTDDHALFGRLVLEINQAGLSWTTILKKQEAFHRAYAGFDIDRVAGFDDGDVARLLGDAGIIRNRRKIEAAIGNARRIQDLQREHGSFRSWLDQHAVLSLAPWIRLFKATFTFTGQEITKEFLLSTGYLPGAHETGCPVYREVLARRPPWLRITSPG